MLNLLIVTNIFILPHVTFTIVRNVFRIVKRFALIEFVPINDFVDVDCNNLEKG